MRKIHIRARHRGWSSLALLVVLAGCVGSADGDAEASEEPTVAERSAGEALLDEMIAFHDPDAAWSEAQLAIDLEESRPDGTVRSTRIELDNRAGSARITTQRDGHDIVMQIEGDAVSYQVDASAEVAQDVIDSLRLGADQIRRTRNYYAYLYGLPMKLRDAGTRIDPETRETTFQGRQVVELRVTYDPEVGSDTWLFYADPESSEMVGYRFFHDEEAGDGEYIVLEETQSIGSLRLPKKRTWYTNQGDELLGTDTIAGASGSSS